MKNHGIDCECHWPLTRLYFRLAWLELRLMFAKLHYKYDTELVGGHVDWNRDVEMHLLWKKPSIVTRLTPRA